MENTLQDLPCEMICCVLEFVDSIDSIRFMRVCKLFYRSALELSLSLDLTHKKRIGTKLLMLMVENCKNHLSKLISLNLSENNLSKEAIECLCKCQGFPNLKILNLQKNNIENSCASFIGSCSNFQYLEELNLHSNNIADVGSRVISLNENMAHSLKTLIVSSNNITNIGIKFISKSMVNLTKLNISNNSIGNEGVHSIATNLINLTELNLQSNTIERAGEVCKNLTKLTHLDLSKCNLGNTGLMDFVENSKLVNLRVLNLRSNTITDLNPFLHANKSFVSLQKLCLSNNYIGGTFKSFIEGCMHSNPFPSLEILDLSACSLTYEGVLKLSSNPILDKVRKLGLSGNNIGNAENHPKLQNICTSALFTSL